MKSWIEISARRLAENYSTLRQSVGKAIAVLPVIKADAYGHNARLCARVLAHEGAAWLGVTDVREAIEVQIELAKTGMPPSSQPRILIMSGSLPEEAMLIVEQKLTPVAWTIAELEALREAAVTRNRKLEVHLEIDTGMSRQGCAIGAELDAILSWFAAQTALTLDGVMTHFASAEVAGSHQSAMQQRAFEQAIAQVRAAGFSPRWIHAGNSSVVDNLHTCPEAPASIEWLAQQAALLNARPMVRTGLALYGHCLPIECEHDYHGPHEAHICAHLQPVLTWKARVIGLREIAAGTHVGYGASFTATHTMRLALLPVGYADGLRRELSSSLEGAGWVMLHGQRAPIIGRVSMNLTVVDVTAIESVAIGDQAVILGEGITAEDHARLAETISYEILCGLKATPQLIP